MINFKNRLEKKLLLLQRNEFLSSTQVKIRKLFGRALFTKFLIYFFQEKNLNKKVHDQIQKEFESIKDYLPRDIKNIMDIGCGIGLIDIFFNKFYHGTTNFYLLDKNYIDNKIVYGFSEDYESYNISTITKNFLINNNIENNKLNLIDVEGKYYIEPNSIDLCVSLVSMGYHYPLSIYLELLKNACHEKTVFIFDIATEYQSVEELRKIFKNVKIIENIEIKHPRVRVVCSNILKLI